MNRSAFIRGLLDDPRDPQLPQYDPQGGWNTARFAGQRLAALTGPGGVADAFGLLGEPSVAEQARSGDYLGAGLTAAGVIPGVGALKAMALAPRSVKGLDAMLAARKAGNAATEAKVVSEASNAQQAGPLGDTLPNKGPFVSQSAGNDVRSVGRAKDPGLYHGISNIKLDRPIGEFFKTVDYTIQPDFKTLTPEWLGKQNAVLFGFPGDRAAGGGLLTSINGVPLVNPTDLQAGASFMNGAAARGADRAAWASDLPVINKYASRVRKASEAGYTPFGGYVTMDPKSVDYSHHVTDTLLDRLRANMPDKNAIEFFDRTMREGRPGKGWEEYADWPGLLHPDLEKYLYGGGPGKARTKMAQIIDNGDVRSMGFPDISEIRYGVTDPALLHAGNYETGHSIVHLDPSGRVIKNPVIPHKTYNTQIGAGDMGYVGGFEHPIPFNVMYRDWINAKLAENPSVYADPKRGLSSLMMAFRAQPPSVTFNPETVDRLSQYLENRRRGLLSD